MLAWTREWAGRLYAQWRRSVRFRVVAGTAVGVTVVVVTLIPILLGSVSKGVLGAKEASALAEASAARSEAQRLLDAASSLSDEGGASRRIDAIVAAMGARGAQAGLFDVLMLASEPGGLGATPERGTNLVSEKSVPAAMRELVSGSQRQAWTYTTIQYTDGQNLPGLVVGAPVVVRDVGPYELYQLFPLAQEQETLDLVRNATVLAGVFIILGLVGLAAAVTYWLVTPVHDAARTAREFSAGHFDARMRVRGEDDLALLAESFNDMAGTLQRQIGELEAMSNVQRRFVADVSHELRTPMTTVRMAADLLHERRLHLPADHARALELLQSQLNRFEALLSDLLETSRQDSGAVDLTYQDVDLPTLVQFAVNSMLPLIADANCTVEVHGESELIIECDVMRVERIVTNLLSNAVEHGAGAPIQVGVFETLDGAQVSVSDQGAGLSEQDKLSVFTRFWRADPSRVRRIGGTGLGLSIALGDAQAHGGSLTVVSEIGRGATFTLDLPKAPDPQARRP